MNIPEKARIKVYWSDRPENYSKESRERVKSYFNKKYGVSRNNIDVIYKAVKEDNSGKLVEITDTNVEDIMSVTYQRELFKTWLVREGKDVSLDRLISLDTKVNGELDVELDGGLNNKYKLNWLMVNNFLSFGPNNFFNLNKHSGFTVVNSTPGNQSGKCIRYNTKIKVKYNVDEIVKKLGFLPDELK
jgi:hypothetical protein